ncbi:MAG TPA: 1,2-phenylacetyl-CoA epoxidase subunit PaaD [Phycisphaerales bacterium]|nr:1,2-phenylacetyl-CoA epoxidase subunit PaaD [Phycisphaerales bacterium]
MPLRDSILSALHSIPDPEMPISIVDLGLLHDIQLDPAPTSSTLANGSSHINSDSAHVTITLLPTFIGCPALDMIAGDVRAKISALPGVSSVTVNWLNTPAWSVDRITAAGRASLKTHGVTVPAHGSHLHVAGHDAPQTVTLKTSALPCPYCGSKSTHLESAFGPTRCRTIYYCSACKNSFEHMKSI